MPSFYPYQDADIDFMAGALRDHGVCWNLNEQRTGKLIEFIGLCEDLYRTDAIGTVLIVAPLSTLWNVRDEFQKWLGWEVLVNPVGFILDGTETQPTVVAVNKETLRDPEWWGFEEEWDLALIDEAHHFRGHNTQQTKGLLKLDADRRVIATGTPLMNGLPYELFPLLRLSSPHDWPSFWSYLQRYAAQVPGYSGAGQDPRAPWRKGSKEKIREYLAPFTLRRTYAEVHPELPPMVRQTIHLRLQDLDADHWALYQQLKEEWRTTVGDETLEVPTKLTLTMRLRQMAASPGIFGGEPGGKVDTLIEWIGDQHGKGVVWCWHLGMADVLVEELIREGMRPLCATGEDSPERRAATVAEFQADAGVDAVLVATIGALKEGITLDTASWAAFAEESWLPADNDQAAKRIMGPNQTGSPLVATFVLEDTIERHVERVLARKTAHCDELTMMLELIAQER